jgi:hypothetical protein
MDMRQLGYGLTVALLLIVLPFLSRPELLARCLANERLRRIGSRGLDLLRPAEPVDELADHLYRVFRRERLRADIQRLQRILAADESMSATRQLANRLAYDWLLRELAELGRGLELYPAAVSSWDAGSPRSRTTEVLPSRSPSGSSVETLDVRLWP